MSFNSLQWLCVQRLNDLDPKSLLTLEPSEAVTFLRRLLWAEAKRVNIAQNLIMVPSCINVADGGIDAKIENAEPTSTDVIPKGTTGFQVKNKHVTAGEAAREVHKGEKLENDLKDGVVKLMNEGGTYILVAFDSTTVPAREEIRLKIINELKSKGFADPKVNVYTADLLVGFAEKHISLLSWFKKEFAYCQPHSSWAENYEITTPATFYADEERKKLIETIRTRLRTKEPSASIFRIEGLPGIGKTRFVFELLKEDDFSNSTIYIKADQFIGYELYNMLLNTPGKTAIVVVDECSLKQHDEIVRAFGSRGSRIQIFTISFEMGPIGPPAAKFRLNGLSDEIIDGMLKQEYKLPVEISHRLARFSDGYPRIAVLLAESYQKTSGSIQDFLSIADDDLFNRLICDNPGNTSLLEKNRRVLRAISLFEKIGYELPQLEVESQWLAKREDISWADFQEVVAAQKKRKILQGDFYLYVSPFVLRVRLITEWWEIKGMSEQTFRDFTASIPEDRREDLLERFVDHVRYIAETPRGSQFVKHLLSSNGIFSANQNSLITQKIGSSFFLYLADAAPEEAVSCLERTIGTWSTEQLKSFTTGRREVVWALAKLVIWKNLFHRAARLLLKLAEAENETFSNNSSGEFADLFYLSYGTMATSEASPSERITLLEEMFRSSSEFQKKTAIRACKNAIELRGVSRPMRVDFQVRRTPSFWTPNTWGDLYDAYGLYWDLLVKEIKFLTGELKKEAGEALLSVCRTTVHYDALADKTIDTIEILTKEGHLPTKQVLGNLNVIIKYDQGSIPETRLTRIKSLHDSIHSGNDIDSKFQKYVGFISYDTREDPKRIAEMRAFAKELTAAPEQLYRKLEWLFSEEAENAYELGMFVGELDITKEVILKTTKHLEKNSTTNATAFLGGLLRGLFLRDKTAWDEFITFISTRENLYKFLIDLIWRSGFSEHSLKLIIEAIRVKHIDPSQLGTIALGGVLGSASEERFLELINLLLSINRPRSTTIALQSFFFYYVHQKKINPPLHPSFEILTHPALLLNETNEKFDHMVDHYWTELANRFYKLYPEKDLELAYAIINGFDHENSIISGFNPLPLSVLNILTAKHPKEIWAKISTLVNPPLARRSYYVGQWLENSLHYFPRELVLEWVTVAPEKRASFLAKIVPKDLIGGDSDKGLVRDMLVRFGSFDAVLSAFTNNYFSGLIQGSQSAYWAAMLASFEKIEAQETNANVLTWVRQMKGYLDNKIQQARIFEERRGF
ncbi:MAG: hypothetical protein P4M08_02525 [Oligoflexia bacterium]|nr:hypothetical protein [Oligoflexia bacterium]